MDGVDALVRKLDCAASTTTSYRMNGEATEFTVHIQNSCKYEDPVAIETMC